MIGRNCNIQPLKFYRIVQNNARIKTHMHVYNMSSDNNGRTTMSCGQRLRTECRTSHNPHNMHEAWINLKCAHVFSFKSLVLFQEGQNEEVDLCISQAAANIFTKFLVPKNFVNKGHIDGQLKDMFCLATYSQKYLKKKL